MNTPTRWSAAGIVILLSLGSVWAAEPTINITNDVAQGALQNSHRQQIDEYVAHHVKIMAGAATKDAVVASRRKLTDSYNRFGSQAQEYTMAFAASLAKHGEVMLKVVASDDRLASLKKVNLALAASQMGQVSLSPLAVQMVSHSDASVRFFGWEAYASMRPAVLATGGKPTETMFAALSDRLAKETDPHVLGQMMRMFVFRGIDQFGGLVSQEAYDAGVAQFFKVLQANWTNLCRRVLDADGQTAEAASIAVETPNRFRAEIKGKVADKDVAQMLANMAWSAGKAFDQSLAIQAAADLARKAEQANRLATREPTEPNLETAKAATAAAAKAATKAKRTVAQLPSVPQSEFAISTISKLLTDCEAAMNSLTGAGSNFIDGALKKRSSDPGADVRMAVFKWVDALSKKYEIKQPEDIVPAK